MNDLPSTRPAPLAEPATNGAAAREAFIARRRRLAELTDPRRPKAKLVRRLPHEYHLDLGPGEFE